MTVRRHTSPLWFAAPLLAVYAAAFFIVEVLPRSSAPGAVAAGLTLDLVVIVPALYYAVLVRGRGWPNLTLAPVFLLSYAAASLIIPAEHHGLLSAIRVAIPVVELGLIGFVGVKAVQAVRERRRPTGGDAYDRIRETIEGALGATVIAGVVAYEAALLCYAFSVRAATPPDGGFSYHRRSGYGAILAAVLMAAALELVGIHFLLRMWSETAVWVHAALSLYGVVWLVGDYRAMRRRPHEFGASGLRVRVGLRWDVSVSWDEVVAVRRTRRPALGDGYLSMVPFGSPRYVVELRAPVEATGPYGLPRRVQRLGLTVDEPEAFEARLRALGVAVEA